jgi:hypothetical protein
MTRSKKFPVRLDPDYYLDRIVALSLRFLDRCDPFGLRQVFDDTGRDAPKFPLDAD